VQKQLPRKEELKQLAMKKHAKLMVVQFYQQKRYAARGGEAALPTTANGRFFQKEPFLARFLEFINESNADGQYRVQNTLTFDVLLRQHLLLKACKFGEGVAQDLFVKDRMPSLQAHGNQVVTPNLVRIIYNTFELSAQRTMVKLENASLKLSEACGPGELVELDEPQERFVLQSKERIPDGLNSKDLLSTVTSIGANLDIPRSLLPNLRVMFGGLQATPGSHGRGGAPSLATDRRWLSVWHTRSMGAAPDPARQLLDGVAAGTQYLSCNVVMLDGRDGRALGNQVLLNARAWSCFEPGEPQLVLPGLVKDALPAECAQHLQKGVRLWGVTMYPRQRDGGSFAFGAPLREANVGSVKWQDQVAVGLLKLKAFALAPLQLSAQEQNTLKPAADAVEQLQPSSTAFSRTGRHFRMDSVGDSMLRVRWIDPAAATTSSLLDVLRARLETGQVIISIDGLPPRRSAARLDPVGTAAEAERVLPMLCHALLNRSVVLSPKLFSINELLELTLDKLQPKARAYGVPGRPSFVSGRRNRRATDVAAAKKAGLPIRCSTRTPPLGAGFQPTATPDPGSREPLWLWLHGSTAQASKQAGSGLPQLRREPPGMTKVHEQQQRLSEQLEKTCAKAKAALADTRPCAAQKWRAAEATLGRLGPEARNPAWARLSREQKVQGEKMLEHCVPRFLAESNLDGQKSLPGRSGPPMGPRDDEISPARLEPHEFFRISTSDPSLQGQVNLSLPMVAAAVRKLGAQASTVRKAKQILLNIHRCRLNGQQYNYAQLLVAQSSSTAATSAAGSSNEPLTRRDVPLSVRQNYVLSSKLAPLLDKLDRERNLYWPLYGAPANKTAADAQLLAVDALDAEIQAIRDQLAAGRRARTAERASSSQRGSSKATIRHVQSEPSESESD
jgi:hypothetical protein